MRPRFLADENFDQDIVAGILRREPGVDFELPQGMIPERTPDPLVLRIAADASRILVTHDVRTMPRHFTTFIEQRSSPGVILIPQAMPISDVIEDLLMIWSVSEAHDWNNLLVRLPL
ncbi:MAG: DUF5615 family PIN-like protein [Bryobacter sp.]|nr:DUF5615 family PIN-like protein [Bryobacter sp.]